VTILNQKLSDVKKAAAQFDWLEEVDTVLRACAEDTDMADIAVAAQEEAQKVKQQRMNDQEDPLLLASLRAKLEGLVPAAGVPKMEEGEGKKTWPGKK
jgi:hypothetical protein